VVTDRDHVPFRRGLNDGYPGGAAALALPSNTWINPITMTADQLDIDDIALALSNICRYNGNVARHLSVAEHSVRVAYRVIEYPGAWRDGGGHRLQLAALLHDAAEAYIGDMVNPLKRAPEMTWFVELDDRLTEMIWQHYDCVPDEEQRALIKRADHEEFLDEWDLRGGDWDAEMAEETFKLMFRKLRWCIEEA
jgi:uncharacterized protein Usg